MLRVNRKTWIALEWKLADMWVGLFWQRKPANYHIIDGRVREDLHVWVCLVPCLPIHIVRAIV
jgi:hypothetical protein